MSEPSDRPQRPDPATVFRRRRQDLAELVALAHRAVEVFHDRAPRSFGRFSDLLDELLPADPAVEARIARAVSMEPDALRRLRSRQLAPLRAPRDGVARLVQALRLDRDRETLRELLARDQAAFGAVAARGDGDDGDALDALDAALDRMGLDAPDRATRG